MKRASLFLSTIASCLICTSVRADYLVSDEGAWPKDWPRELEPLRKQSSTIQGSLLNLVTHHIPFSKRDEFESAWPPILKVKSKGAPIILVRSPSNHWHFGRTKAGVRIHSPPPEAGKPDDPARPIPGTTSVRERWMRATYIELVVDGQIVDLNRVPLPADTPIIDQRFDDR